MSRPYSAAAAKCSECQYKVQFQMNSSDAYKKKAHEEYVSLVRESCRDYSGIVQYNEMSFGTFW